jgi:DNA-binding MarR family transcriptional regulator
MNIRSPAATEPFAPATGASATNALQQKWGTALHGGFVLVPSVLLRYQSELGIKDAGELLVLLHLLMSWWTPDEAPFPRVSTIADRMGVSARTVQRHLRSLESKHLVRRKGRRSDDSTKRARTTYDLAGLVRGLQQLGAERPRVTRLREITALRLED